MNDTLFLAYHGWPEDQPKILGAYLSLSAAEARVAEFEASDDWDEGWHASVIAIPLNEAINLRMPRCERAKPPSADGRLETL